VPDFMTSTADWQLVSTDGKTHACHSLILIPVSNVLANIQQSVPASQMKKLVDISFKGCGKLAESFLKWVYQRTLSQLDTDLIPNATATDRIDTLSRLPR
jgi:hypothetical protein